MLDTVSWVVGALLLAGVIFYALRRRKANQPTTYVKTDENPGDGDTAASHVEDELQELIQQVKRKLRKELADDGR